MIDLAMPFMIQFMKDYVGKVDTLMADRKDNMEARKVRIVLPAGASVCMVSLAVLSPSRSVTSQWTALLPAHNCTSCL